MLIGHSDVSLQELSLAGKDGLPNMMPPIWEQLQPSDELIQTFVFKNLFTRKRELWHFWSKTKNET